MTARMFQKKIETKKERFVTGFMQTVQLNYDLDHRYMPGVDIHQKDAFGNTALFWAIYHHNMSNVILLLENGATLEVSEGVKAPFCAVKFDNLEVLIYLIEKGIEIMMEHHGEPLYAYVNRVGSKEIQSYFDQYCSVRSGG